MITYICPDSPARPSVKTHEERFKTMELSGYGDSVRRDLRRVLSDPTGWADVWWQGADWALRKTRESAWVYGAGCEQALAMTVSTSFSSSPGPIFRPLFVITSHSSHQRPCLCLRTIRQSQAHPSKHARRAVTHPLNRHSLQTSRSLLASSLSLIGAAVSLSHIVCSARWTLSSRSLSAVERAAYISDKRLTASC